MQRTRFSSVLVMCFLALDAGCSRKPEVQRVDAASNQLPQTSRTERTTILRPGEFAPNFVAHDHQGGAVELFQSLRGQDVVLIFYPGDDTPGCTKQLCAVRDDYDSFLKRGVLVLGVNPAGAERHAAFVSKYSYPFQIVVDRDSRIAAAYGCKGSGHTRRVVYGITRDGRVAFAEEGMPAHERIFAALGSAECPCVQ